MTQQGDTLVLDASGLMPPDDKPAADTASGASAQGSDTASTARGSTSSVSTSNSTGSTAGSIGGASSLPPLPSAAVNSGTTASTQAIGGFNSLPPLAGSTTARPTASADAVKLLPKPGVRSLDLLALGKAMQATVQRFPLFAEFRLGVTVLTLDLNSDRVHAGLNNIATLESPYIMHDGRSLVPLGFLQAIGCQANGALMQVQVSCKDASIAPFALETYQF